MSVWFVTPETCTAGTCPRPLCDEHRRERDREYGRRYRERNRERARAKVARWVKRHPEEAKVQARQRTNRWRAAHPEQRQAWRAANPDRNRDTSREAARRWRDANRDKFRAQQHRRRERAHGLEHLYCSEDNWLCFCGEAIESESTWHWDHDPPLAWRARHPEWSGPHRKRRAHAHCNLAKGARV